MLNFDLGKISNALDIPLLLVLVEHLLVVLVLPQSSDTASQCQQGGVDVVRLLHPFTVTLLFTAFRPG